MTAQTRSDPDPAGAAHAPAASSAVAASGTALQPAGSALNGSAPSLMAERCGWSLVWLAVLLGGLDLWGSWIQWSPAGALAPVLVLAGIVGTVAVWLRPSPRGFVLQGSALVSMLVSTLANQGAAIHVRQFYSTDSSAFDQVAARLVQSGHNPYTTSLAAAERLLQTPSGYWTYTLDGGHITTASYPAGSFLIQLPALLLGFHHQVVDWTDLVAWMVTGVLLFALVPSSLRWFALLLFATPFFAAVFSSGGTDATFLPFLILGVWRWDRFGVGPGAARWIGPLSLGLACSMKQTPWFCVPVLATGLYLEARRSGRRPFRLVAAYLGIVVGVFGLVNLPYLISSPSAWAHGTVLPLTNPLVPDGQGLISLALHGVGRGVSLAPLTLAGALVFVSLLGAMVAWYPQMKRIWLLVLPLVFFVAARSLSTYLVDLFPAAMVAALTVAPAPLSAASQPTHRKKQPSRQWVPWLSAGVAVVTAAIAVVACVVALTGPPVVLGLRGVRASRIGTELDAVTLAVHNKTAASVTPHFMVSISGNHPTGYWNVVGHRTLVLGPHATATITIVPTSYTAAPAHGTHWLVEAFTASPAAMSVTRPLFWTLGRPPRQIP
jgi:hypothetical protein